MSAGLIEDFERRRLPGHGIEIDALVGGSGPPLLLLHGYPQTRLIWKAVAPSLARRFTLVMPDLRGYGRSDKPVGGHHLYAKRIMALDQIATMTALGFRRFGVAGHDRGGRVAYRLAADHPESVSRLAVLDIVPTGDSFARTDADAAMRAYHWYMLAQDAPLPETLIGGNPEAYLRLTLERWAAPGFTFDPESFEDYRACFCDPASIHATCEDYRAGWHIDRLLDHADAGRQPIRAPLLALWSEGYGMIKRQPLETWRLWAADVSGQSVAGGHFVCEEAPLVTRTALESFFDG